MSEESSQPNGEQPVGGMVSGSPHAAGKKPDSPSDRISANRATPVAETAGAEGSVNSPPRQVHGLWRILYAVAAAFFFVLGVLGLMLPGLPTTPFLLLTSYFLVRISPALNQRLLRSRFVGPILTDWQVKRGVRPDIKVKAISVVVIAVTLTILLTGSRPVVVGVTILFASIGVFVILKLPTIGD